MIGTYVTKRGYSLLELVVAIAIMALLATLIGPNITKGRQDQEIIQTAIGLKAKLIQVQSLALSPPRDNNGATKYGLRLTNASPDIHYEVRRLKSDGTTTETYPLGTQPVVYKNSQIVEVNPLTIWYEISNNPKISVEDPSGTSTPSSKQITIKDNRGETRIVTINAITGEINVQ